MLHSLNSTTSWSNLTHPFQSINRPSLISHPHRFSLPLRDNFKKKLLFILLQHGISSSKWRIQENLGYVVWNRCLAYRTVISSPSLPTPRFPFFSLDLVSKTDRGFSTNGVVRCSGWSQCRSRLVLYLLVSPAILLSSLTGSLPPSTRLWKFRSEFTRTNDELSMFRLTMIIGSESLMLFLTENLTPPISWNLFNSWVPCVNFLNGTNDWLRSLHWCRMSKVNSSSHQNSNKLFPSHNHEIERREERKLSRFQVF